MNASRQIPVTFFVLLATLVGCGLPHHPANTPPDDRRLYTAAVDATTGTEEERLAVCNTIGDARLRGDCTLSVAQAIGIRSVDDALAWCPKAEAGNWRSECFFASADAAGMRGEATGAAQLCDLSGRHKESCRFHQFQLDAQRTATQVPNDAEEAELVLVALHNRHGRPVDSPGAANTRRAWYASIVERHGVRDAAWCTPLSATHQPECREAVHTVLRNVGRRGDAHRR